MMAFFQKSVNIFCLLQCVCQGISLNNPIKKTLKCTFFLLKVSVSDTDWGRIGPLHTPSGEDTAALTQAARVGWDVHPFTLLLPC